MNKNLLQATESESFYSKAGYLVHFNSPRWVLSKDISIPIVTVEGLISGGGGLRTAFKQVLGYFARTHSAAHVVNIFYRCRAYLDSTAGLAPFSVESLVSYRATLDKSNQWYMAVIRGFLRQWSRLGYQGLSDDTMKLLDNLVIKGNEKGYAVQSMCPESGPLTDFEMAGVVAAVFEAFGDRRLTLEEVCCVMLLAMTGRRPIQIAALKVKDVFVDTSGKYWINFPRAKQRGHSWRSDFRKFAIVEDLWLILGQQAVAIENSFREILGQSIPGNLVGELPLFPNMKKIRPGMEFQGKLDGDFLHTPTIRIKSIMHRVAKVVAVISERTGEPIVLNPNRFRYTLGTNLAREGRGELVIAEALDHSDTQNVGVYVKNIPEIVERIDKAVALQLAPFAQAFRGVLVTSERDARRGDDPSSRISNGRANVGTCGSYGFCGALAPIACYTCAHFQPWLDGPHEEVLDRLLDERDRVRDNCGDLKIASTNDRLILAVGDVINRCQEARGEVVHG